MIGKLFGNLVPAVTFCGYPAKVTAIDLQPNESAITVLVEDGRKFRVTVQTPKIEELS